MRQTAKAYNPVMRELRLAAVADRLDLPKHAGFVYWAMANVLAMNLAVHVDRIVRWFETLAISTTPSVEGALLAWAKTMRPIIPDLVEDAVRVLAAEGLITTEARMFQTSEGEMYERTKVTMLPVEAWENDKHFMAALAVRW